MTEHDHAGEHAVGGQRRHAVCRQPGDRAARRRRPDDGQRPNTPTGHNQ